MHEVNLFAVLVAGIVPMVVGSLWYGPIFGKRWMALMEMTAEEIQEGFNPVRTYGVSFLLSLVTAFVLAQLIAELAGGASAMAGLRAGERRARRRPVRLDGPGWRPVRGFRVRAQPREPRHPLGVEPQLAVALQRPR